MLQIRNVREKIRILESEVHKVLLGNAPLIPHKPARDIEVLDVTLHPRKKGLSHCEGQARLLHDLASIELQAMELAFRSLVEFSHEDVEFREQMGELAISESRHLTMCLDGIEALGFKWGDWPIHISLWEAVASEDSLLDRLLIVHRYLEGSGLDAGETIMRKLNGVDSSLVQQIIKLIMTEEIDHVNFGSRWYKEFCHRQGHDPDQDFCERVLKLNRVLPRRLEKISHRLRKQAGFTEREIHTLEDLREWHLHRVYGGVSLSL